MLYVSQKNLETFRLKVGQLRYKTLVCSKYVFINFIIVAV